MSLDAAALANLLSALADLPERIAALERGQEQLRAEMARVLAAIPPTLATTPEAAKVAKVSVPTMRRWIKAGWVPTVKVGNTVRVNLAGLAGVDAEAVAKLAGTARAP